VRAFTHTVFFLTSWLPGDTLRTLVAIVNRIINYSMNYIDEAVLARCRQKQSKCGDDAGQA
jgi:hypothetical protein